MRPRELHATRVGLAEAPGDGVAAARTVADVMTDDPRPIVSEMPLHQASRLLLEQKARARPVVDREGHVVGVLGEEELRDQLARKLR